MGVSSEGGDVLLPIGDDECLLRLVWSSDVVDGELQPTAFVSADLRGPVRGLSVDRRPIAKRAVVSALAVYQRSKAVKAGDRDEAHISEISCRAVRALADPETKEPVCIVEASPMPKDDELGLLEDPAHAQIASRTKRSPSKVKELRLMLLPLFSRPCPLERYRFPDE